MPISGPEEEFLSTQCCYHTVLWCSGSHLVIILWGRINWLFFRLSICLFLSRSLGFVVLFSTSPFERLQSLLLWSSLLPDHHIHLIWVDLSLMAPLELSLVFECLWPLLTRSCLNTWLSQEPSDLSELNLDNPSWPSCRFSLWASF
jgi:hypothetical protein